MRSSQVDDAKGHDGGWAVIVDLLCHLWMPFWIVLRVGGLGLAGFLKFGCVAVLQLWLGFLLALFFKFLCFVKICWDRWDLLRLVRFVDGIGFGTQIQGLVFFPFFLCCCWVFGWAVFLFLFFIIFLDFLIKEDKRKSQFWQLTAILMEMKRKF